MGHQFMSRVLRKQKERHAYYSFFSFFSSVVSVGSSSEVDQQTGYHQGPSLKEELRVLNIAVLDSPPLYMLKTQVSDHHVVGSCGSWLPNWLLQLASDLLHSSKRCSLRPPKHFAEEIDSLPTAFLQSSSELQVR